MTTGRGKNPEPEEDVRRRQELLAQLLALATRLAREAGDLVESMRADSGARITGEATTKSSSVDLVTEADTAAERHILDGLRQARPEDGVLGEEGSVRDGSTGIVWLIDPIDGTTNYVYDLPAYTVSLAAQHDGELIVGVVMQPRHGVLYAAALGQGATCNGKPITCNDKADLETSLVATGFSYLAKRRREQADVLVSLLPQVRDIRRLGSAALDLCLVASGQVDAYYERGLNPWDLAAGVIIASEAGATVANLRDGPPGPDFVLAACPGIFPELQAVLRKAKADDWS